MVQNHAPAILGELVDIGRYHRLAFGTFPGHADVFVEHMDGQQGILGAADFRQPETQAGTAAEHLRPGGSHRLMAGDFRSHGVHADDRIARQPHRHHGLRIGIGKGRVKCRFGFVGGGEHSVTIQDGALTIKENSKACKVSAWL